MMMKREYRGQRSVKALADYIRQQKSDPIQELHDLVEITTLDRSKRNIIGYFEQKDSEHYRVFQRVANILHDDCAFFSAFGAVSKPERYSGDNIIYKPPGHSAPDMVYLGSMTNFDGIYNWIQDKCVPLVREITFENGEELTEEGLPFLILFHMKEDTESLEIFQNEVARQLISEKGAINFLHADCDKFRHPLLHIQKTPADCPVIAIDSFRHMYVFEDFKDILIPGRLKQFVFDLHSGKLHREFHHGPDPTDTAQGQEVQDVGSSPPESSFQKLAPSEYRPAVYSQMGPCARPQCCQGAKPEGEDPQYHIRKPNARGQTGSKLAFLWAWVGAIGQESFYIWSPSQSQFGERLFLSLKG
ncbi:endoplasmic reticulum resident protein 44 isoform 8-T8 [Molossus nigricans]